MRCLLFTPTCTRICARAAHQLQLVLCYSRWTGHCAQEQESAPAPEASTPVQALEAAAPATSNISVVCGARIDSGLLKRTFPKVTNWLTFSYW
jgi:hypothetical protein